MNKQSGYLWLGRYIMWLLLQIFASYWEYIGSLDIGYEFPSFCKFLAVSIQVVRSYPPFFYLTINRQISGSCEEIGIYFNIWLQECDLTCLRLKEMATVYHRHFQIVFVFWKILHWRMCRVDNGSGSGFVPIMWQVVYWSNGDIFRWRIFLSAWIESQHG